MEKYMIKFLQGIYFHVGQHNVLFDSILRSCVLAGLLCKPQNLTAAELALWTADFSNPLLDCARVFLVVNHRLLCRLCQTFCNELSCVNCQITCRNKLDCLWYVSISKPTDNPVAGICQIVWMGCFYALGLHVSRQTPQLLHSQD